MAEVVDDTFTCSLLVYLPIPTADIIEVKVDDTVVADGDIVEVPTDTVTIKVSVTNVGIDGVLWIKLYEDDTEIASDSATIVTGGIEVFEFSITYTTGGTREIKIEAGHYTE